MSQIMLGQRQEAKKKEHSEKNIFFPFWQQTVEVSCWQYTSSAKMSHW